ncbi:MAG TPA: hypothetical protein VFF58_00650 [Candidatus Nitrosotalea sp.]|nr:hypothetical protein [Candidatus Nitrosotalea sp.]
MAINLNPVSVAPSDLIKSALLELGVIAAGEPLLPEDAGWGLEKLQRNIDQINARQDLVFAHSFTLFNLLANHAPHTIGPGGDFAVPARPVAIVSATFVLNSSSAQPIDRPINIRDEDWWALNPTKSLVSSIVTDLFYSPDQPLGTLNFFPICNVVNPVRLEMWVALAQALTLQTQLGFVQGYWEAIVLDLAVSLCPSYEKSASPELLGRWNRAMRIIEANNNKPPRIDTSGGMPSTRKGGRPDFNFLTGMRE